MEFALVKDGKVVNVIVADSDFAAALRSEYDEVVDVTGIPCGVEWSRTAEGFVDDRPQSPVEEAPPAPRHITPLALLRRLTIAEEVALELSSVDNTSAGFDQRAQAAAVRVAVRRLTSAKFIDLDDPELAATLAGFEQAGLLGAGRAAEIVSAAVQPQERP
jgi:hypothetical protein